MSYALNAKQLTKCLSAYPLFRCADEIDETCHKVGNVFRPHHLKVVGAGQHLSAYMDHLPFKNVTFNRLRYSASVSITSEPLEKFLLVMIPLQGTSEVSCGTQRVLSNANLATVVNPTSDLSMRWDKDCDQLILRIDRTALEKNCEAHLGHPLKKPINFELGMDLCSEGSSVWESIVSLLAANPIFTKIASAHPIIAAQAEQLLISSLLMGHSHQYQEELLNPQLVVSPGFVRKAEEYMEANAKENFTIEDLANHIGISLRSLYAGFQRYKKMSPATFLKNMRLDIVRTELIAARDEARQETVTRVAMTWGFSHLGHFTKAYHERYDELPSETLRKR